MRKNTTIPARSYPKQPALTLIELLVVTVIFAGLGVLLVNSLFAILRGNAKAELTKEIRQSGSFALDVMTKKISAGNNVTCSANSVSFSDANNRQIAFICQESHIASQSGTILTPLTSQTKTRLTECSFACKQAGLYNQVTISFALSQVGETPGRQEEIARQSFTKVILVRNR